MLAFINGAGLCASLVVSIGPQNIELIRLGFLKHSMFTLATVYIFCELFLITLGVIGAEALFNYANKGVMILCLTLAIILLFYLGFCSFQRMYKIPKQPESFEATKPSRATVIKTGLFLSILNPLAILDTVIIIGGVSSQYHSHEDKLLFGLGAMFMSLTWFYGIAYCTSRFSSLIIRNYKTQQLLEGFVGSVMWLTALVLTYKLIKL